MLSFVLIYVHWNVIIVNTIRHHILFLDSAGYDGRIALDQIESVLKLLLPFSIWTKIDLSSNLPRQNNSRDCGAFVLKIGLENRIIS